MGTTEGIGVRIEAAELRVLRLPLKFRFETSFGVLTERTILLLTLFSDGLEGYAEGVMERLPLYREETVDSAWYLLRDVVLPRVVGKSFPNPASLVEALKPLRGNRQALAMVEMAFWDLWGKGLGVPLWQLLGGACGRPFPSACRWAFSCRWRRRSRRWNGPRRRGTSASS